MNETYKFYSSIREILNNIRQKDFTAINSAMMKAYCQICMRIIKKEQHFKNICILQIQFTKSCPFLSVFHSYAKKEPAA